MTPIAWVPAVPAVIGVTSPCIKVCRIDEARGWCEGCLRSLDEIAFWSQLDDDDKRAVWALIEQRRAQSGVRPPAAASDPGGTP